MAPSSAPAAGERPPQLRHVDLDGPAGRRRAAARPRGPRSARRWSTTSPARSSSIARTARCFGPPSATAPVADADLERARGCGMSSPRVPSAREPIRGDSARTARPSFAGLSAVLQRSSAPVQGGGGRCGPIRHPRSQEEAMSRTRRLTALCLTVAALAPAAAQAYPLQDGPSRRTRPGPGPRRAEHHAAPGRSSPAAPTASTGPTPAPASPPPPACRCSAVGHGASDVRAAAPPGLTAPPGPAGVSRVAASAAPTARAYAAWPSGSGAATSASGPRGR